MIAIAAYLIKSILTSGAFYFYYQLLLKNKHFHSFNRYFLLSVVAISAILPMIDWKWHPATIEKSPLIESVENAGTVAQNLPNNFMVSICYATVCFILLSILAFKIRWIYKVKKSSKCTQSEGFTFIETSVKQAPFSFLNNLFWKQGLSLEDTNGEKVFRHELTHIKQRHTYDRLFLQILSTLFWINPFYWLLQKELVTIHEFIADEVAVGDSDTEAFASMLLYTHNNGSYLSPSHGFFNSQIKRRLIMIGSSKKTSYAWLRKVSVVPVGFATIFALSLNSKAQTSSNSGSSVIQVTTDTVPTKIQEKTVVGYSTKQNKQSTTPPASPEKLKEVTVVGYGTKKDKQATTTPSSPEKLKEVTVVGYSIKQALQEAINKQEAIKRQSQEKLKEVTVEGYSTKQGKQEATQPSSPEKVKEVIVEGYGTKKDAGKKE
jgi:beta-lactamase regulating signal transducer with metallopeptidase domain